MLLNTLKTHFTPHLGELLVLIVIKPILKQNCYFPKSILKRYFCDTYSNLSKTVKIEFTYNKSQS